MGPLLIRVNALERSKAMNFVVFSLKLENYNRENKTLIVDMILMTRPIKAG